MRRLVNCDSSLVVNYVKGEYQAKDERMKMYLTEERVLIGGIENLLHKGHSKIRKLGTWRHKQVCFWGVTMAGGALC